MGRRKHKKTKNIRGKGLRGGAKDATNAAYWKEILSVAGETMGDDLDQRLKVVSEVVTTTIVGKYDPKIKALDDKINALEQKIIDLSKENTGLTRTLSEFVKS